MGYLTLKYQNYDLRQESFTSGQDCPVNEFLLDSLGNAFFNNWTTHVNHRSSVTSESCCGGSSAQYGSNVKYELIVAATGQFWRASTGPNIFGRRHIFSQMHWTLLSDGLLLLKNGYWQEVLRWFQCENQWKLQFALVWTIEPLMFFAYRRRVLGSNESVKYWSSKA